MGASQSKKRNRLVGLEVANRRRQEIEQLQEAVLLTGSFRSGHTNIDIEPTYKPAAYYLSEPSQTSLLNAWQPDKQAAAAGAVADAAGGLPRPKKVSRRKASQQQMHYAGMATKQQPAQQRHHEQTLPQSRQARHLKARRLHNQRQQQQSYLKQLPLGVAANYYATSCQNLDSQTAPAATGGRQSYDDMLFEAEQQQQRQAANMQDAYAGNYFYYHEEDEQAAAAGYGYDESELDEQENLQLQRAGNGARPASYQARGPRYKLNKRGLAVPIKSNDGPQAFGLAPLAGHEEIGRYKQLAASYRTSRPEVGGSHVFAQHPVRPATAAAATPAGVALHRDHPIYLPMAVADVHPASSSYSGSGGSHSAADASAASTAQAAGSSAEEALLAGGGGGPQGQQQRLQQAHSELGASSASTSSVLFQQRQKGQQSSSAVSSLLDPHRTHFSVLDCAVLPNKNTDPTLVSGNTSYCPFSQQQQQQQQHHSQHNNSTFQNNNNSNSRRRYNGNQNTAPITAKDMEQQQQQQNRGLAYTRDQREKLGLIGHLPAAQQDFDLQIKWAINYLDTVCKQDDELAKYVFLRNLKDLDERLFYATLMRHVEKLMPIVYTPTVGLGCQKFSDIYMRPRGLFISLLDLGKVSQVLANWAQKDVRVIVVTDGERILGLGDLGANGMGISIGKLSLYTALAGLAPKNVLPITLDVGTDNQQLLDNPYYVGLRQRRTRGQQYDLLVNEFMQSVVSRWGHSCLIQFEDFGNHNAFRLLQTYRKLYCTFNDDIQGTASVCLSGLLSASRLIGRRLSDCSYLFYGAGEANLGTAELLELAMVEEGLSQAEARARIWLVDSKGLVVASRANLTAEKQRYARQGDAPALVDLIDIVEHSKATAIIGASAQASSFNEAICKRMAEINERPIIFALSNPTSKAECTAEQAYKWTGGRCVFASGSPFEPFTYDGRKVATGQGNNAYIFPAVGLAAIAAQLNTIPTETFLVAARALSDQLTSQDTSLGLIYPSLARIRQVTLEISSRVLEYFFSERLATYRPEPSDKRSFLKSIQYDPNNC